MAHRITVDFDSESDKFVLQQIIEKWESGDVGFMVGYAGNGDAAYVAVDEVEAGFSTRSE
jgi:hypothetical protein